MIASNNIRAKQISPAGVGDRRQRMAERHDEGHPRQCRNRTERREHVPRRRRRATIATHIRRRHQCGRGGPTSNVTHAVARQATHCRARDAENSPVRLPRRHSLSPMMSVRGGGCCFRCRFCCCCGIIAVRLLRGAPKKIMAAGMVGFHGNQGKLGDITKKTTVGKK